MNHYAAAAVAICITIAIFTPYLMAVWRRTLHPHVISWVIWGLTTMLVAGGQLIAGAGIGAAPIVLSGLLSSAVAVVAMLRRQPGHLDTGITRFDGWCLAIVLAGIPIWLSTGDVSWSMLLLTVIDLVGFAPAVRVVWQRPHSESVLLFLAFGIRNALAVLAVESAHLTTVVFPAVIGTACAAMAVLMLIRRRYLSTHTI